MEDKKITPQEGVEIISAMINATKQRVAMPDVRISLMWAAVSILTAITALVTIGCTRNPVYNYIWFAIPVIGCPINYIMCRKHTVTKTVKTQIDIYTDNIWKIIGYLAIPISIICLIFNILGHSEAWLAMLCYGFIVIGFGCVGQGVLIKEQSYVLGGALSIVAGFGVIATLICNLPLNVFWVFPLYILCMVLEFVVPAFVIRKKIDRDERA